MFILPEGGGSVCKKICNLEPCSKFDGSCIKYVTLIQEFDEITKTQNEKKKKERRNSDGCFLCLTALHLIAPASDGRHGNPSLYHTVVLSVRMQHVRLNTLTLQNRRGGSVLCMHSLWKWKKVRLGGDIHI